VINVPFAHLGALPIEETLGSFGPAFLVAVGVAWAQLRARLRRTRARAGAQAAVQEGDTHCKRTGLNRKGMAIIEAVPLDAASSDIEQPSGRETTARRRRRNDPQSFASAHSSRPRSATSERLAQRPPDAR
jgi:hypothetical protein